MGRERGWKRLARVYGLVEQMRSVELRVAAGAVDEVDREVKLEAGRQAAGAVRGRAGLLEGDRAEWAIAETTREYGEARIERLEEMKVDLKETLEAAVAAHEESRVRLEQMKSVLDREEEAEMREEARQAQAVSDDRFAGQAFRRGKARQDDARRLKGE